MLRNQLTTKTLREHFENVDFDNCTVCAFVLYLAVYQAITRRMAGKIWGQVQIPVLKNLIMWGGDT